MIAIFLNTKIWGGVDVLSMRLASYLRDRNVDFFIISPKESRIRDDLPWAAFVEPCDISNMKGVVTHVIAPSVSQIRDEQFPWDELGDAKFFTWAVHANDSFRSFFPFSGKSMDWFGGVPVRPLRFVFRSHLKIARNLFSTLAESKALALMDGATDRALKFYYPNLPGRRLIVPIPSPVAEGFQRKSVAGTLSVGYFGRIDSFKWTALRTFVSKTLSRVAKHQEVEFHAVSEGDYLKRLSSACEKTGIKCFEHGFMSNHEARQTLCELTDVVVAMGTSALDMAGSGHPCIILDPAIGIFASPQKKFRFVHETDDFTLGEFRDSPGYLSGLRDFDECIRPMKLTDAALKGKDYVLYNHDPSKCFDTLMSCVYASEATVAQVGKMAKSLDASFRYTKQHLLRSMLFKVHEVS